MKFYRLFSVFLLVLFLYSCNGGNEIIGNWKLDGVNVEKAVASVPDDNKDFARKMINSAFEQLKGKLKLTFAKDGKFKISTPDQEGKINIQNGTWSLSKDAKKLTTIVDEKNETIGVVEITSNRLVLSMPSPGQSELHMTFVH